MTQPSELAGYYQARAPEYDAVYAKPERQPDLRTLEHQLPTALRGRRVLDVACGTGYWTRLIAARALAVTALDITPATLSIARSRCDGVPVEFVQADAFQLPFAAGSFDAAFASFWISHVRKSRLVPFLSDLHRCLRPGATVVLLDNRFVEGSSTPIASQDSEGNTFQDRRLENGSITRVLKNFPGEAELRDLVERDARAVDYQALDYYWVLRYELQR